MEVHFSAAPRMSPGAMNWPFLMLTGRPVRAAATSRSVWRARKAGIWSTSTTSATGVGLLGQVDVRQHGHVELLAHGGQYLKPALEPDAAEGGDAGAVGLVEGRLEDEGQPQAGAGLLEPAGDVQAELAALDDARAGHDQERLAHGRRRRCRLSAPGPCAPPLADADRSGIERAVRVALPPNACPGRIPNTLTVVKLSGTVSGKCSHPVGAPHALRFRTPSLYFRRGYGHHVSEEEDGGPAGGLGRPRLLRPGAPARLRELCQLRPGPRTGQEHGGRPRARLRRGGPRPDREARHPLPGPRASTNRQPPTWRR